MGERVYACVFLYLFTHKTRVRTCNACVTV